VGADSALQHDLGVQGARIGICEDDAELRSLLARTLGSEGLEVRATATGSEAVALFTAAPPDLLVLDIGLPDADGRDVCQALRSHGVHAPVLFLTARDALTDRLSGFHSGGDDYLTKPFAIAELIVRVQALLKRATGPNPAPVPATGLRLDAATHSARNDDRAVPLTPTEFRLLATLTARPGVIVRRHELTASAWPDGAIVHDNTLDAYVGRLRRKLRELESDVEIKTARGVGYTLG